MLVAQDLVNAYMASMNVVNQIYYLTDNTPGVNVLSHSSSFFLIINTENLYYRTINKLTIEMSSLKSVQPIARK